MQSLPLLFMVLNTGSSSTMHNLSQPLGGVTPLFYIYLSHALKKKKIRVVSPNNLTSHPFIQRETDRQRHTQRDRERKRERDRDTDRQTDTETDRDRQTETERDRDRETDTERDRDRETERDRQTERQRQRDRDK